MTTTLKPCPFCGRSGNLTLTHDNTQALPGPAWPFPARAWWTIKHLPDGVTPFCGASLEGDNHEPRESVIARWNERHDELAEPQQQDEQR